ncbi:MAG TPA: di-heme oxidoredictase family protein, partial [Candidatus Obscuribacter sp.]|nr:di-heme oxidoredictase family protein [Candidatus Obscuribacter sp.]
EWRTTPLWGLRFKKFLLHDGRTQVIHDAIMFHGGQAEKSKNDYARLPKQEQDELLAFLRSL